MAFVAGQRLRAGALGQFSSTAQYSGTGTQTIATATDTVISWGAADRTSDHVTRGTSGSGHEFTLNTSGLWAVTVTWRWSATGASATGEKAGHMENSLGLWLCSTGIQADATRAITQHLSIVDHFTAADKIRVEVFQNSGGNEDLEYNGLLAWPRINLALILAS